MLKIIEDHQARLYELTYLLPTNMTDSQLSAAQKEVQTLIEKYTGEVVATQDWGKKDLAYKLKHQSKKYDQAVYTHLLIKFFPDKVQAFEKELLLNEELLRHLLVVSDNQDEAQVSADKE